jgi:hypothetical protein
LHKLLFAIDAPAAEFYNQQRRFYCPEPSSVSDSGTAVSDSAGVLVSDRVSDWSADLPTAERTWVLLRCSKLVDAPLRAFEPAIGTMPLPLRSPMGGGGGGGAGTAGLGANRGMPARWGGRSGGAAAGGGGLLAPGDADATQLLALAAAGSESAQHYSESAATAALAAQPGDLRTAVSVRRLAAMRASQLGLAPSAGGAGLDSMRLSTTVDPHRLSLFALPLGSGGQQRQSLSVNTRDSTDSTGRRSRSGRGSSSGSGGAAPLSLSLTVRISFDPRRASTRLSVRGSDVYPDVRALASAERLARAAPIDLRASVDPRASPLIVVVPPLGSGAALAMAAGQGQGPGGAARLGVGGAPAAPPAGKGQSGGRRTGFTAAARQRGAGA